MECMNLKTLKECEDIFLKNSFLIGNSNVIPYEKVSVLLGEFAASNAFECGVSGKDVNIYYTSIGNVKYFTQKGFMKAMTYHNIENYIKMLSDIRVDKKE